MAETWFSIEKNCVCRKLIMVTLYLKKGRLEVFKKNNFDRMKKR